MNFFGIGGWEWVIIAVAALVIFGPGKLPEVAGQAGRAVRDFRRMTGDLTGEFEKSLNESGAGELRKSFDKELKGMRGQVESVGKSVERDLKKGGATASSAKKGGTPGKTGAAAKSNTSVKKAAGKASTAGSTTAKSAAQGKTTIASSKQARATAVVERKASKADPLADVSFMDDQAEVTQSLPTTRRVPTATSASSRRNVAAPTEAPEGSALARVRERRSHAGYSRVRIS